MKKSERKRVIKTREGRHSGYFVDVVFKPINREKLVRCIAKVFLSENLSGEESAKHVTSVESV